MITIAAIVTALSITISTIVLAITDVFGGSSGGAEVPPSKDRGTLKKMLDRLVMLLKDLWEKLPRHCLQP